MAFRGRLSLSAGGLLVSLIIAACILSYSSGTDGEFYCRVMQRVLIQMLSVMCLVAPRTCQPIYRVCVINRRIYTFIMLVCHFFIYDQRAYTLAKFKRQELHGFKLLLTLEHYEYNSVT
jgi:hypothetical protein